MRTATVLIAMFLAMPVFAKDSPPLSEITVRLGKTRPERWIPFPEIRDWKTLKITLMRSPCFGSCPIYKVEIDGDGNVRYEGFDYVAVTGKHRAKVPVQSVRDLYAQFKKTEFFWLFDEYAASMTDIPGYTTSISFDGQTKRVLDYAGTSIGMPRDVRDLEKQIDTVADTGKWVQGRPKNRR
jgi:hypothetical protein